MRGYLWSFNLDARVTWAASSVLTNCSQKWMTSGAGETLTHSRQCFETIMKCAYWLIWKCQLLHSEWSAARKDVDITRAKSHGRISGPKICLYHTVLKPHSEWGSKQVAQNIYSQKDFSTESQNCITLCVLLREFSNNLFAYCCLILCKKLCRNTGTEKGENQQKSKKNYMKICVDSSWK